MTLTKPKIFLYFCLSFIIGVAVASFVKISLYLLGIFFIGAILIIIIGWPDSKALSDDWIDSGQGIWQSEADKKNNWKIVVFGFCIIFIIIGIWRFQDETKILDSDLSKFNEKEEIVFRAIIDRDPERRMENQKLIVRVVKIEGIKENTWRRFLIITDKYPEYQYGDELEIVGFVKMPQNYNDFDYQGYLAKDDIYFVLYYPEIKIVAHNKGNIIKSYLFKIKNGLEENLSKILSEPQASLANGLIFGERATLPQRLINVFNIVGITHIIALSGFNITIIADNLRRFFNALMISRRYSFWLTVILIFAFVIMTGASASIVRAAVMGILLILAQKTGRIYSVRNALVFAGVVMIFQNPKILRFDLGFQFSFLATIGLIYLSPFFESRLERLPKIFDLRGIAAATLAAQVAVLPLILYIFARLSLIAPVTNLLILPSIPLTMFFGFFASLVSWLWLDLGRVIGLLAWLFLTYQIKVAELMAKMPLAVLNIKINLIEAMIMYIVLCAIIYKIYLVKRKLETKDKRI